MVGAGPPLCGRAARKLHRMHLVVIGTGIVGTCTGAWLQRDGHRVTYVSPVAPGEAVKLVIVKKDPALTEAQVREYCKANLTGYKQPKVIEFRTDLPKTPVGKILRRELRDKK